MQRLVEETSKIYSIVEGASVDDIVVAMQSSVVNTRRVVRWAQGQEEATEELLDQTAIDVVKVNIIILPLYNCLNNQKIVEFSGVGLHFRRCQELSSAK